MVERIQQTRILAIAAQSWLLLACVLGWPLVYEAGGRTFDVAPGDDLPPIVTRLQPGDTVHFHPGIYRQPITIRASGTAASPIRLRGEGKATFSGLTPLKVEWQKFRDGIYQAQVDHPVRQLFADGTLMTPARWPNMTFAERWDNAKWPAADAGSTYGTMVDAALAEAGVDFTGCMAILNIGSWQTFRRMIVRHRAGLDRFDYVTDDNPRLRRARHPVGMDRYCIYGRAALDAPGEWFFDAPTSTLFFYPPRGRAPEALTLESKRFAEALVVEYAKYVEITGLNFRGATVRLTDVNHCKLENVRVEFGSTIANPFGPNQPHPAVTARRWNARRWFGETSLDTLTEVTGDDNVIRNVTVHYSEGPALTVGGRRNLIENCLFEDNDWQGLDYGFGLDLLAATPVTVRYVTLARCGGAEGLRLANHGPSLVEYCHLHHCGLRQSDGAVIQAATAGVAGTEIRYNWVHDHNAFHWGGNGIRGDDKTRGLLIHHNVIWNCREKGIVVKGDRNRVYHNTCFDNPKIDILLPRDRLPGKTGELVEQNHHSEAFNNIGQVTGSWSWEKAKLPPYAQTGNNVDAGGEVLRNPRALDFRLTPGCPLIDTGQVIKGISEPCQGAAPDLGAYEFGAPNWKAGYRPDWK